MKERLEVIELSSWIANFGVYRVAPSAPPYARGGGRAEAWTLLTRPTAPGRVERAKVKCGQGWKSQDTAHSMTFERIRTLPVDSGRL